MNNPSASIKYAFLSMLDINELLIFASFDLFKGLLSSK